MGKLFKGIGKALVGVLTWVVGAALVLTIIGLLATFGIAVIGIIVGLVVIGLIIGGIGKVFRLDKKPNGEIVKVKVIPNVKD